MFNRTSKQFRTGGHQLTVEEKKRSLWLWVGIGHDKNSLELYTKKYCGNSDALKHLNYLTNGKYSGYAVALFASEQDAENAMYFIDGLHYRNSIMTAHKLHLTKPTSTVEQASNALIELKTGQSVNILPTYFEDGRYIYFQFASQYQRFKQFQYSVLQNIQLKQCDKLVIGDSILARFGGDGLVYRARVEKIDSHQVEVFYIDYGNTESLPESKIYDWDTVCDEWPQKQVIRCHLENANRLPHTKLKMINDFFLQRFVDTPMMALVGNETNGMFTITMQNKDGLDINDTVLKHVNLNWLKLEIGIVNLLAAYDDSTEIGILTVLEMCFVPKIDKVRDSCTSDIKFSPNLGIHVQRSCEICLHYSIKLLLKHNKTLAAETLQSKISVSSPYYERIADGPSCGTSIVCAFLSLALNKIVPADIAFTGEVSATGQIYSIGKLKEKLNAAHYGKIKTVFIPSENSADYMAIKNKGKYKFSIYFVQSFNDVAKHIFPELYS